MIKLLGDCKKATGFSGHPLIWDWIGFHLEVYFNGCLELLSIEDWGGKELRELNEAKWEATLVAELMELGKTESDLVDERKLVDWKVQIARKLKRQSIASNPWIAGRLKIGDHSNVSRHANQTSKLKA